MKTLTFCGVLLALLVAITVGPAIDRSVYAGRGFNIRITVKNTTPYPVKVAMTATDAMNQPHKTDPRLIGVGSTHYWICQVTFPDHLSGTIYNPDKKEWVKLKSWCVLYNTPTEGKFCAPGTTKDTTWTICPYSAERSDTRPFEYSHSFCKQ